MEFQTILTVKQVYFEALIRILRLYMEQDDCVCDALPDLPLFRTAEQRCPPDCEQCTWCMGRKALRDVGQAVDDEQTVQECWKHPEPIRHERRSRIIACRWPSSWLHPTGRIGTPAQLSHTPMPATHRLTASSHRGRWGGWRSRGRSRPPAARPDGWSWGCERRRCPLSRCSPPRHR